MYRTLLPKELVSLIHYIELNKSGWWDKSLQRIILTVIWLLGKWVTFSEISDYLRKEMNITIEDDRILKQLVVLKNTGQIVILDDKYKIAEQLIPEFEKSLKNIEIIEIEAKNKFLNVLGESCSSFADGDTWTLFNEELLHPMIQDMGVRVYNLLSGEEDDFKNGPRLLDFLKRFPAECRQSLHLALIDFFDPKDKQIRSYILCLLSAYFFVEASGLSSETLNQLNINPDQKPVFNVFLDTNFVFSILALHENPSNEAAISLVNLLNQLSKQIELNLFVLSPTIYESIRVLNSAKSELVGLKLTQNMAEAALETSYEVRGMAQKYFVESKKTGHSISAEEYFSPYINNFNAILKSKGVELFDQNVDNYRMYQRVIDDILLQQTYEKKKYGERAKSYEKLTHDIVLWHFIHDKRSPHIDSPVDAKYWVVTVDYRFIKFDDFKQRKTSNNIPICIHPTTLIQMLQFWVPRTEQFEEAMLSSMRLPFLFQEFDIDAEKVTINILKTLSRFENIGDLSKDAIASILINESFRVKYSAESSPDIQLKLIREAIIEEYQKIEQELHEEKEKAALFKNELRSKQEMIAESQEENNKKQQSVADKEKKLSEAQNKIIGLEKEVKSLKELNRIKDESKANTKERIIFCSKWRACKKFCVNGRMVVILHIHQNHRRVLHERDRSNPDRCTVEGL